jgi:hypothetical protein
MPSSAENIITSNLTVYEGHSNLSFYRNCEKQGHKIAFHIQNLDHFKHGEKFNEVQRKYVTGGVERSGHLHSIKAGNLIATGIYAFDYKWPNTSRYMQGDCHDELSSSGAKKEGISRIWSAIRNGTLGLITTSDVTSPSAVMIKEQDKGVHIDWKEVDKRYPEGSSNELEGFRPGKNFDSKIDFYKTFPWVKDTENLVIELADRKRSVGGLDESTGVALAGNLFECSGDWINKLETITYQNCKKDLSEKNVMSEFNRLLDESARELRVSFSCIMDQIGKLATICEDTYNKEFILFDGTGTDSGKKAKASQMRGGHAGIKDVIHIDSENEPWVREKINSLSPEYIKESVRAIVISESLKTRIDLIEYLRSKGVITYGFTANEKSEFVKENPERWIITPNQNVHVLESPNIIPPQDLIDPDSPPKTHISSFQFCVLPAVDCVTSYWLVKNNSTISQRHKRGE